jgi:hypothetical protein
MPVVDAHCRAALDWYVPLEPLLFETNSVLNSLRSQRSWCASASPTSRKASRPRSMTLDSGESFATNSVRVRYRYGVDQAVPIQIKAQLDNRYRAETMRRRSRCGVIRGASARRFCSALLLGGAARWCCSALLPGGAARWCCSIHSNQTRFRGSSDWRTRVRSIAMHFATGPSQ